MLGLWPRLGCVVERHERLGAEMAYMPCSQYLANHAKSIPTRPIALLEKCAETLNMSTAYGLKSRQHDVATCQNMDHSCPNVVVQRPPHM